jgi:hypothetical protein
MIIKARSYPHPVLSPFKDDVLPNMFEFSLSVTPDADNFYLNIGFAYTNETLLELVKHGKATHCVHLECRQNFYRQIFSSAEPTKSLSVSASELVGRVEATGFIKAQVAMDAYCITGSHADYGDNTFCIAPGDVLAVAPSQFFEAYVDYDPLQQISSILTIRRSPDKEEAEMQLDPSEDKLVATLSQKDYDRYAELKADPTLGPLLANQVVVPAILEAVHLIRDTSIEESEFEMRKRWFRSISKKLEEMGINIRDANVSALEAAQTILRRPLRRSLEGMIKFNSLEDQS